MRVQPFVVRPVFLLHVEALCGLVASCAAYQLLFPHHWVLFACLLLVPDLSLLPYLRGPNAVASTIYNVVHSYVLPAIFGGFALQSGNSLLGEISLIWLSHISMDRLLGYGLKYPASFKFTHMQSVASPGVPSVPL